MRVPTPAERFVLEHANGCRCLEPGIKRSIVPPATVRALVELGWMTVRPCAYWERLSHAVCTASGRRALELEAMARVTVDG